MVDREMRWFAFVKLNLWMRTAPRCIRQFATRSVFYLLVVEEWAHEIRSICAVVFV